MTDYAIEIWKSTVFPDTVYYQDVVESSIPSIISESRAMYYDICAAISAECNIISIQNRNVKKHIKN